MAIYHFQAKMVQRSRGHSAVAIAARRAGAPLFDERLGQIQRPLRAGSPVYSEVLLPQDAPAGWADRQRLWNEVETFERRKDAGLAREVEVSLPLELPTAASVELARTFAAEVFVGAGMAVDLNVWVNQANDPTPNPWASLLMTTRALRAGEQGCKVREWNTRSQLVAWRSKWAVFANAVLRAHGLAGALDHRSFAERGINLEPQNKIGPAASRRARAGETMERMEEHKAIARRNADRRGDNP